MAEHKKEFTKFFQSLSPEKQAELREPYGFLDLAKDLGKLQWKRMQSIENPFKMGRHEQMEFLGQFAGVAGILKPVAFAKLLKTAGADYNRVINKGSVSKISLDETRHLIDALKVPFEEFTGLRKIKWRTGLGNTSAQYKAGTKTIELNPFTYAPAASRHEFVHKRQWLPRAENRGEIEMSNLIRLFRSASIQTNVWNYATDPVELQARIATKLMDRGVNFNQAYLSSLGRSEVYLPSVQELDNSLVTTLVKLAKQARIEGKSLNTTKVVEELLKP